MRSRSPIRLVLAATLAALALVSVMPALGAAVIEKYSAFAVNMGTPGRTGAAIVEIGVERWSSTAERDRLVQVLVDRGPEKLLDSLRELPRVGYIRTPDSIGYDLHFARKMPGEDGGEDIVLATDRPIRFWEAVNRPRTIDYPFTYIQMHINPDGEGEGKMSVATKITFDKKKNEVVLENFSSEPVRLTTVKKMTN
jgi:hypothetical protein